MSGEKAKVNYLSEHLAYEVSMLRFSFKYLNNIETGQLLWNAMFECFWLHFRIIAAFLGNKDDNRNFNAFDFADSFIIEKKAYKEIEGLLTRIQSQIMHLGKIRNDGSKRIDITDIINAHNWVNINIEMFISMLPEKFKKALNNGIFEEAEEKEKVRIQVTGPITASSNPSMMKLTITGPKNN